MAIINSATLSGINVSYNLSWNEGRKLVLPSWQDLASEYPQTGDKNVYPFMAPLGQMREWVGPKEFEDLSAFGYELRDKEWEKSFEVKRREIEDDKYAIYNSKVEQLGVVAENLPNIQVQELLEAGSTTDCWDGEPFFDTAHPVNPLKSELGTFANLHTSKPLNRTNLVAMRALFMQTLDMGGVRLAIPPDTLFVHPDNEITAHELLNATLTSGSIAGDDAGSRDNVLRNLGMRVVVLPQSSETGVWYLAATRWGRRVSKNPLIVQMRKRPVFIARTDPQSERVFNEGVFQWSTEARVGFGYGMPQMMFRMNPS